MSSKMGIYPILQKYGNMELRNYGNTKVFIKFSPERKSYPAHRSESKLEFRRRRPARPTRKAFPVQKIRQETGSRR